MYGPYGGAFAESGLFPFYIDMYRPYGGAFAESGLFPIYIDMYGPYGGTFFLLFTGAVIRIMIGLHLISLKRV